MSPASSARAPLPDLVEESLDEALFLWRRWEQELTSLTRNLDEIWSWTEDRLHGALAGVRAAGPQMIAICEPLLSSDEPLRITLGTAVLGSGTAPEMLVPLRDRLAQAQGPALDAMIRALEVAGSNQALGMAAGVLGESGPAHAAALCRLKTARSARPGQEMVAAFESGADELQAAALRAARYVPDEYLAGWMEAGLASPQPLTRLAAMESGIARRSAQAWNAAVEGVAANDPRCAPALRWIAMLGTAEHHGLVYAALRVPQLQMQALWALGHVGTRQAVELCLQGMKHEKLARAAAEAYCHITGADLERDSLAARPPEEPVPSFEEDDLEADLVPAPEEMWPLPDLDAVARHWQQIECRFQPDVRYIRGVPASTASLLGAVECGPMLRRADLVLDLAARSNGRYDVQVRAFAARQRVMMAHGRALLGGETS